MPEMPPYSNCAGKLLDHRVDDLVPHLEVLDHHHDDAHRSAGAAGVVCHAVWPCAPLGSRLPYPAAKNFIDAFDLVLHDHRDDDPLPCHPATLLPAGMRPPERL